MKRKNKNSSLLESFNSAFNGFLYVLKNERNLKLHIIIGIIVILTGLFFKISLNDFLILLLLITLVISAEVFNTAIEMILDLIEENRSSQIKVIKDISASSVLVVSILSVVCGYLIFVKNFPSEFRNIFENIANSPWHLTFIILISVVFLTLVLKFTLKKTPTLSGGMPSLHSGIAFSIWMAISFFTFKDFPVISLLVFILAFWVAQSRVAKKIHTIEEVVIGGIIGIFFTILLFQLFWR